MTSVAETAGSARELPRFLKSERWQRLLARVVVWGALILLWELSARIKGPLFLPTPLKTAGGIGDIFSEGYASSLASSMRQLFVGFGIAVGIGVPLGLLMGSIRAFDDFLSPYVNTMFIVSKEALLPLLIVLFGTREEFRVVVVFLFAVFLIILNTAAGVRSVDPGMIEAARAFGLKRLQIFVKVVVPAILPFVVSGLRIGFGLAIKGMVIAEIWVTIGIGLLLTNFAAFRRLNLLFGLAILIIAIGVIGTSLLGAAERRLRVWANTGQVVTTTRAYWLSNHGHDKASLRWALRAVAVALFFLVWELIGRSHHFIAIEPATAVIRRMVHDLGSGVLLHAALGTLRIAALGYVISAVVGVVAGSLIGLSKFGRWTLDPLIHAGNATPMTILVPVLGIYFGFETQAKIFLVFMFCVFIIAVNTAAGMAQAPRSLLETASAFGVKGWRLYTKVVFPNALPAMTAGLRIAVGRAIQGAIIADLLLQSQNLGQYMLQAGAAFNMTSLLAGIFLTVLLGTVLMSGARRLEAAVIRG
jgi:ABC-type nitrate/sulfonate/bicarbonate transport system permease component